MADNIEKVSHQLQLDESLPLHKKGWQYQRLGWIMFFLFILLAALGLFGNGLISKATNNLPGAVLQYERFQRHEARMEMKFTINSTSGDTSTIAFRNDYLKHFRIESIVPEPADNITNAGMVHYTFNGTAPLEITFYLVPQDMWQVSGDILVNGQQLALSHFIYP